MIASFKPLVFATVVALTLFTIGAVLFLSGASPGLGLLFWIAAFLAAMFLP